MRATKLALLVALLLLCGASAGADTISGGASAGWQAFPAPGNVNQNGVPFWDNRSMDGSNKNIGYFLTNTGAFSSSTQGPGAMSYWGNSNGTADPNVYLSRTNNQSTAAIQIEIAGYANINILGWYDVTNPSVLYPIFMGPANSSSAPVTFSPSANYGLYLQVGTNGAKYYTQSSLNPNGDASRQHFAFFTSTPGAANSTYWIGVEDLAKRNTGIEGYGDFNDMIIKLTPVPNPPPVTPVPEPATLALFGTGLIGIAGIARRRLLGR